MTSEHNLQINGRIVTYAITAYPDRNVLYLCLKWRTDNGLYPDIYQADHY